MEYKGPYKNKVEPLVRRYAEYLQSRRYSEKTILEYARYITRFLRFLARNKVELESVTQPLMEKFRKRIKGYESQRVMASTINNFYTYRKVTFNDPKPLFEFQFARTAKYLPPVLPLDTIQKIRKATDKISVHFNKVRTKAMIELFIATAIREGELVKMLIDDIDFKTDRIKIRGKGRKEREVFLTPPATKALLTYLKYHERRTKFVFYSRGTHKELKHGTVVYIFDHLKKRAGIKEDISVTPHGIRRTVATQMAKQKMSIYIIQQLLGHSTPTTTARYVRIDTDHVQDEIKARHPFI